MGQSFLAKASLPKHYWFWAVWEATIQMNKLPVKAVPSMDNGGAFEAILSKDADLAYAMVTLLLVTSLLGLPDQPRPLHCQQN
jgi:hypothetical protein